MKDLTKYIKAHALKNALEHDKAVVGKVLPKLFNHGLDKKDIGKIMPELQKEIKKINNLSKEEKEKLFKEYEKYLPDKVERKEGLQELTNTKDLVMRFEPSPSGPLHVGHAYVLALNSEYVRKYKGKLILRIGDTNPENIYVPAYNLIPEDANWLTKNNISKIIIQSKRLPKYYKHFETLLENGQAYICTCDSEKYKKLINDSKACPCRNISHTEQIKRWKKMFKTYKKGEAVGRIKTNLEDKNPAMRDFPVFRINDSNHPKTGHKYRVWPLMNMAVSVDDAETKVTHVIRAKDHADNAKRQAIIHKYLRQKTPEALFVGRINFEGMPLSTTKTMQDIKDKKYSGWDDIRLPSLLALKRRGFQPEALIKYSNEVGVTLTDKTVKKEDFFKSINAFNREVIDKKANRYFFISNPKKIKIKNAPKMKVSIPLHPDFKNRGTRKFSTSNYFCIEDKLGKNENYRLMHLFNFKNQNFISKNIDDKLKAKMIHWLPVSDSLIPTKILMTDGETLEGLAEPLTKKLKVGDIIQFERFGFVRLDKKTKSRLHFWFLHR
jgi:glutamyl-tRNA synthetase